MAPAQCPYQHLNRVGRTELVIKESIDYSRESKVVIMSNVQHPSRQSS